MSDNLFAIVHTDKTDIVDNIVSKMKDKKIVVFTNDISRIDKEKLDSTALANGLECKIELIDAGLDSTEKAKITNKIIKYAKDSNVHGFLHVIQDSIEILNDPDKFIADLNAMMDKLDYDVWFNTITDKMNFIYSKYTTRLSIALDTEGFDTLGFGNKLNFVSHSNNNWIAINLDKVPDELLYLNDEFDIPMYYIIEMLARRRNLSRKDQLYFMNMYMSIPSEIGAFKIRSDCSDSAYSRDKQKAEDELFHKLNINHAPNNNVDSVIDRVIEKLRNVVGGQK